MELTETLIEIVKSSLESGEDVLVSGFGKFCVKCKDERKGRNPANGEDAILPAGFDWSDTEQFQAAYRTLTDTLRPWTIDLHIAQNDATVKGSGSHDKTGRHCLPDDQNGKLDIVWAAGHWLRDETGAVTKRIRHICWDGCMFPNKVMTDPETWNKILAVMSQVREAHGWQE